MRPQEYFWWEFASWIEGHKPIYLKSRLKSQSTANLLYKHSIRFLKAVRPLHIDKICHTLAVSPTLSRSQAPELKRTAFHLVLDTEERLLKDPNLDEVPHKIYYIKRDREGNL